jgi:hypothetical protein
MVMTESSSQIAISTRLDDYFREPVVEALRGGPAFASEATQSYLVQLLSDYAKPTQESTSPLSQSVTLLYRDALSAAGQDRFRRLQLLGDGVLYSMGFFHGTQLKGADEGYIASVGRGAYGHAARMLRTNSSSKGPDVLQELSANFDRFIQVLRYVSDWVLAKGARDEQALMKLYERWRKTGSAVLREELGNRGLLPASDETVH